MQSVGNNVNRTLIIKHNGLHACNSFTLNCMKTQAMIVGSRNKFKGFNAQAPLFISGKIVKFVKQYNYLCIVIGD